MVTARHVMSRSLVQLERGTSVLQTAQIMTHQHVGSIIVTASGFPVGIVTETDMTKFLAHGLNAQQSAVESIMSSPLFSTHPDTDLIEVVNTMNVNHIKKMPVVEKGQVIGIITQTDIIKNVLAVSQHLQEQLAKGSINQSDYTTRTNQLFRVVQQDFADTKYWHMRCLACGSQFVNEETNGQLKYKVCQKCGGQITYDLSAQ